MTIEYDYITEYTHFPFVAQLDWLFDAMYYEPCEIAHVAWMRLCHDIATA